MRCPASYPIPSPISRFFFGCSLDKSLATFLCCLQDHFTSYQMSNTQRQKRHSLSEMGNAGSYLVLSGWGRLSGGLIAPDWIDWIHSFILHSLAHSFIYSFIQQVLFRYFLCVLYLTIVQFSICLSGHMIYHHLGARKVSRREFTESHTGKTLVFRKKWVRWVRHLCARPKSYVNFNLNLKLKGSKIKITAVVHWVIFVNFLGATEKEIS